MRGTNRPVPVLRLMNDPQYQRVREERDQLRTINQELQAALETCLRALIAHDQEAEYDWHSRQIAQAQTAIRKAKGE